MFDDPNFHTTPGEIQQSRNTIWGLIAINAAAFLLVQGNLKEALMLSVRGIKSGHFYELVTAMFLHADFFHIFFNMWSLYIFGMLVAPLLGQRRFLLLYFISGIVGNLCWLAANWALAPTYLLGASGAVFGLMLAVAMFAPNERFLLLFFPAPIKARTMVIVFAVIEIMSELSHGSNIAHLAHLGGLVGAYLYLKVAAGSLVRWDPLGLKWRGGGSFRFQGKKYASTSSEPVGRDELDALLDKISRTGINSLSPDEMARLKQAREEMRK